MPQSIFVNLPVKDLERTKSFFASLGYTFNPQFTDERAACVVIDDRIYAMLLTEPTFQGFSGKELVDTGRATEVLIALSRESREAVDSTLAAALAGGGREARPPADHGFMYERAFEDPDGHTWEVFWMDPAHVQ